MTALVLGAGGFLGLNLVDALIAQGEPPRCGRRRRSNVIPLRERRVPLVQADLAEPRDLEAAMAGCEIVFHLAGHYPRTSRDRAGALATGARELQNALDAAANSGVRRLIFVSSAATAAPAAGRPSREADVFAAAPGFGVYHDLKWELEALALREERLEVLVACPGACLGPWDLRVGTSSLLVGLARGIDPPHPDGVINPVDVRDVARALVRLAALERPPRRVLLAGQSLGLHALLAELAGRYGVTPPSPPLPLAEAVALADAEEALAETTGQRPSISREIVDLIGHGVRLDVRLAETALGLRWTPLSETLDAADAWHRRMRLIPERPCDK